jgi:polar amino acid transport system substrate-binding protein
MPFDLISMRRKLAPHGSLRAAINLSNTLLVSGRDEAGAPVGLAPGMARALAARLEVPIALTPFATPGEITDRAGSDGWDVALIGSEHARDGSIAFTSPYALIEATYLVPSASSLHEILDVDAPGIRVAAPARTAYGLWLERNLKRATLVLAGGIPAAADLLANGKVDALAGLQPWLVADSARLPGGTVLPGSFTAIAQAVGYAAADPEVADFLAAFVEEAKSSGLVARLMTELGVSGVTVAPLAAAE